MHLAELQSALEAALAGKHRPDLQSRIGSLRNSPEGCIEFYRQLLRSTRLEALKKIFPLCAELLGGDHFKQLADLYAEQLSQGAEPDPFGALLPNLVDGYRRKQGADLQILPFLHDLAELEWHLHEVRCLYEEPAMSLDAWECLPASEHRRVRAIASKGLTLQHSRWPLSAIRDAILSRQPWQGQAARRGGWHCIHRHRDHLCVESISDSLALLLNGIQQGLCLDAQDTDLAFVRQQMPQMISRGWIHHLEFIDASGG